MTPLRLVPTPFGGQVGLRASWGHPLCECGEDGCYPTELPIEAWEVAGAAGAGQGVRGTDLIAVAPGHVPADLALLESRNGWAVAGERRMAA